jgi:hypothetical protein
LMMSHCSFHKKLTPILHVSLLRMLTFLKQNAILAADSEEVTDHTIGQTTAVLSKPVSLLKELLLSYTTQIILNPMVILSRNG